MKYYPLLYVALRKVKDKIAKELLLFMCFYQFSV